MDEEVSASKPSSLVQIRRENSDMDRLRVKRKTLRAVLQQCQRALEMLDTTSSAGDDDDEDDDDDEEDDRSSGASAVGEERRGGEAEELCDLLKSRVECPDFLEKLECAQASIPQNVGMYEKMVSITSVPYLLSSCLMNCTLTLAEEGNSWDVVSENDLWEGKDIDLNEDDYVLVMQEDIVEGIACFMAAYLLSIKQTKELTPNQLQEALSKTFSVKKKRGKLRKAWDGSKVIYNVASWGATAIGIYQNPLLIRAASKAFWTSCHVISKLL